MTVEFSQQWSLVSNGVESGIKMCGQLGLVSNFFLVSDQFESMLI